jgi:hypothetical protein
VNTQQHCDSRILIIDGGADLEAVCTQHHGHDGPHTSVLFAWPRLDQRTGHPTARTITEQ